MNYKELISDIKELQKDITIIEGVVDLQETKASYNNEIEYKMMNYENNFWVILGNAIEEDINKCLEDERFDLRNDGLIGEGEYHFEAVLKYDSVDEYHRGYWYIEYIEFDFHQTFLQREREEKLSKLLDDDMDIFFNI